MLQFFLSSSLFFVSLCVFLPRLAHTEESKIKKQFFKKQELEIEKSISLMELLDDTDRLKNEIKRDLAQKDLAQKEEEKKNRAKSPKSKKQILQFGNIQLSISERKEEELRAPSGESKKPDKSLKSRL